jgi:hypothetical protein
MVPSDMDHSGPMIILQFEETGTGGSVLDQDQEAQNEEFFHALQSSLEDSKVLLSIKKYLAFFWLKILYFI